MGADTLGMTRHRPAALAAVALSAGILLGACGGGGGDHRASSGSPSSQQPADTTTAAPSGPSVSAADLKAIDDGTSQLDQQLTGADQGINGDEPDPSQ